MQIETIKLSKKRNGSGYISGCSISISNKEASDCGLEGTSIIKIVDSENHQIIIKQKQFTLTLEILQEIAKLKEAVKIECQEIDAVYFADPISHTLKEHLQLFMDEQNGKVVRPAENALNRFISSLSMENVVDLTLLMYLGRDMDCNMSLQPGTNRFLEFFERNSDIVCGVNKETLADIIMEKGPLLMYLRNGYRLLQAPIGSSLDNFTHNWDEM